MKKITTIEEIHSIEIDILKYFDKFCKKNDLEYSLSYGTLIGAIRHNGFIPWDDDIDVWMSRKDYDKFIDLYTNSKDNNNNYIIVNGKTNPKYYRAMSKLIDKRTSLKEKVFIDGEIGVFIDIWPLDAVPNNILYRIFYDCTFRILNKLLMARIKNVDYLKGYKKIAHYFFQWINPQVLVNIQDLLLNIINNYEHEKVTCYTTMYKKDIINCEDLHNIIECRFEGEKFSIFSNYNVILSNIYGDYMKLPPENERIIRHPANIFWK